MRRNIPLGLVALTVSYYAAAASTTVPDIGIGGDENDSHTHVRFEGIPKDAKTIHVSTHLIVDQAAPVGLNFFAVQVNFPNKTWAHGGPQVNSGTEKANWGGLVNRGGGSKDYKEVNWQEDLLLIECGVEKPNTVPWKWDRNCEYTITVERGNSSACQLERMIISTSWFPNARCGNGSSPSSRLRVGMKPSIRCFTIRLTFIALSVSSSRLQKYSQYGLAEWNAE